MCQAIYLITGRWAWRLMGRSLKIEFQLDDIEPGMHYVLTANHQTYWDPWVVPGSLPIAYWKKMGMLRPRFTRLIHTAWITLSP